MHLNFLISLEIFYMASLLRRRRRDDLDDQTCENSILKLTSDRATLVAPKFFAAPSPVLFLLYFKPIRMKQTILFLEICSSQLEPASKSCSSISFYKKNSQNSEMQILLIVIVLSLRKHVRLHFLLLFFLL